MNKDKVGLIKFLVIMTIISLLPILELYIFGLIFMVSRVLNYDMDIPKFFILLFICFFIIPIIYLLLTIFITRFAIKKHWSKYINNLFKNIKLKTTIVIICILIIYFHYISNSLLWAYLCFCFAPTYIIIYFTSLFCQKYIK